jgi:putative ABC transport system permease protein
LEESDVRARTPVAVVNDAFVRAHLASRPAIGARIQLHDGGDTAWVTIVGTVPDLITVSKDQSTVELIMVPVAQRPPRSMSMLATGPGQTALVTAVRELIREIDRDVPVTRVQRLTEAIARSRRTSFSLAYVFAECGLAGLVLTALGLYGVADTTSRRRVRELAIRRALGSSAHRVIGLIVGESAVPLAVGLAVGCGAALLVGPSLSDLLFGVSPHDPMVFGLVVVMLAAVMLFAVVRPALWAAHAPLTDTLRR